MEHADSIDRLDEAAGNFNRRGNRGTGPASAASLANGLTILRETLYLRIHEDVQEQVGIDSMLSPVSEIKAQQRSIAEIEVYQAVESAISVQQAAYVKSGEDWYLPWLMWLRLGEAGRNAQAAERSKLYLSKSSDDRRLAFVRRWLAVCPNREGALGPVPSAAAWGANCHSRPGCGDRGAAARLRKEQAAILPAIADCRQCRGEVLECAEQCRACGDPLWKYRWLTAIG